MHVWLATTCPLTLIVTLGGVLESGNAKKTASIQLDSFALDMESYILPELCTCMCVSVRYAGVHAQKCDSMHYHSRAMIL